MLELGALVAVTYFGGLGGFDAGVEAERLGSVCWGDCGEGQQGEACGREGASSRLVHDPLIALAPGPPGGMAAVVTRGSGKSYWSKET
ncbi:hypothetical protein [Streptomyces platensis]|uniref:hypothetical protein n=1 Tax=Streptomyces platensis TaxID=58346 RepID=UPI0037982893